MARLCRSLVSVVTAVAFTATQVPLSAFAQNSAQAEVLFNEGKQLMAAQKYEEACKRLTASYKLDPQPNTELVQGVCFQKLGKTASAYNAFLDASSSLPKGSDPQKYAADQAKTLEGQLLKVKVEMQPTVPPDVAIQFDDEKPRDKDFVDIDIALDPGDHDLKVTAGGKHDYAKHFTLKPGEANPHMLIVNMTDKTKEELDAEKNKGGGGQIIIEKPETSWSTVKSLGFAGILLGGAVLIGAGVALILTEVFQGNAITLQGRAGAVCYSLNAKDYMPAPPAGDCTNATQQHAQALSSQVAAIGLAIPGGVIGVVGLIMFIVGGNVTKTPEKPAPAATLRLVPLFSPNMAGMGLTGTF